MSNQRDPSPCCNNILLVFPSGGSRRSETVGPYVMCIECKAEYMIDYKTGELKMWNKNDKGVMPNVAMVDVKLSDETKRKNYNPNNLNWEHSANPSITFWRRAYPKAEPSISPRNDNKQYFDVSVEVSSVVTVEASSKAEAEEVVRKLSEQEILERLKAYMVLSTGESVEEAPGEINNE